LLTEKIAGGLRDHPLSKHLKTKVCRSMLRKSRALFQEAMKGAKLFFEFSTLICTLSPPHNTARKKLTNKASVYYLQ
jgi:hypothetical protein